MSFTFGAQPAASSLFGQPSGFGTQPQQPPFATAATTAAPQFGSAFGAAAAPAPSALQFASSAPTSLFGGQTQPGAFSLGAATSTTAASAFGTPGLFGASAAIANPAATFGAAASATTAFGTGLSFGAPVTSTPAFGAPASTAPNFGFGNTFSSPASTQNTGLTFGTPAVATSSLGLRFATPASSTGLTFGTPAMPTTGISFGNAPIASAPSTGLTFGTPATTVSTFGAPTNTALSFGATSTGTGLTFGTAAPFNSAATTQNAGLTLGGAAAMPNLIGTVAPALVTSGISFGTIAPTTLNLTTTTTATPATSLTFSTAPTILPQSGLLFGKTTSTAPTFDAKTTAGLTFGTPTLSLGGTTTASSTPLTFNTSFAAAPTSTTTGLAASTAPVFHGLGGIPSTKTTTTIAPQQIGLGGISTTDPKQTSTTTPQGELPPKDQPLPNELLQTVDLFKAFLKEQKTSSSEIARFSMKELKMVEANITGVNNTINDLENELQKNKCAGEKLKSDTAQALQYAEMAQRTFEIPAGMQYDNTVPIGFFVQLLQDFERDLQQLRFHLEYINKQVKNGNDSSSSLTPEDLALGLRRLHHTFVTLAGRLQTVHHQVEVQKERYLSLRKDVLNDTSNVFDSQNKELEALEYALKSIANENKLPEVVAGPSPFNSLGTGQAQLLAQNPPPAYPGTTSLGQTALGANPLGSNMSSLFGASLAKTSSPFGSAATTSSFQLQKPPTGSKRGKT